MFFKGNDNENLNLFSPKALLNNYLSKYNRAYVGYLEYAEI